MAIFALLDCNNFYVSCERVFNPALENKPVIVLSNNNGCIIARSNEAKALGIAMGSPFFEYKNICRQHKVRIFSSNFPLYSDMSDRVMSTIRHFCPNVEVYSVDEAFLRLDGFDHQDAIKYAERLAQKIKQWTGIPVSIGVAPTKVLAKIANHFAKTNKRINVISLLDESSHDIALAKIHVTEIWRIGRNSSMKLNDLGIYTAKQLRDSDPKFIRKHLSVTGERLLHELRGISCLPLDMFSTASKNIRSARSFGRIIVEYEEIAEALAYYASKAAEKLRKQGSCTQAIHVFLKTNRFNTKEVYYNKGFTASLVTPTNDTRIIIAAAKNALKQIFQPGLKYKKTGIILLDLSPFSTRQHDFFAVDNSAKNDKVMAVLDTANQNWGAKSLFIAAQGIEQSWQVCSDLRSPRYTTCWNELARVK